MHVHCAMLIKKPVRRLEGGEKRVKEASDYRKNLSPGITTARTGRPPKNSPTRWVGTVVAWEEL